MITNRLVRFTQFLKAMKLLTSSLGYLCAILVLSPVAHSDIWVSDPGLGDTVRIDSVISYNTGIAIVPIYFFNDEPIAGLEVTIEIQSANITVDSFSWVGGRGNGAGTYRDINIFAPGTLTFVTIPFGDPPIPAGTGLLGKLYVHYPINIPNETAFIDSITIVDGNKLYQTSCSDESANRFIPQFRRGAITIQQGCCQGRRGNVNYDVSDLVNISDITYLVKYLFRSGPAPVCPQESNANGDAGGAVNISDITFLVKYLFRSGAQPPLCP
jgi:hypothetical protein